MARQIVHRDELVSAALIGTLTVCAAALFALFTMPTEDADVAERLAFMAFGAPIALFMAFVVAAMIAVPATFMFWVCTRGLRKLGMSAVASAQGAMAVTTLVGGLVFLWRYQGHLGDNLVALVFPLFVSQAMTFWTWRRRFREAHQ